MLHAGTRVLAALLALVALALPSAPSAAQTISPNLIVNAGFEGAARRTSLSSWVAEGWNPWFRPHHPSEPIGLNWEPEFGIITDRPGQAHEGRSSQRWFNTWAIHDAGIHQTVGVPVGAKVTFSIWAFSWSSQQDTWAVSDPGAPYHKWVGIDPTGGTDPFSERIVWSPRNDVMDQWVQLTVTAIARADRVTAFVRGRPEYPVKHNNILVDDAALTYVVPVAPAPAQIKDGRFFAQTGYRIDDDKLWEYFNLRGGPTVVGYPISRTVTFLGRRAQFFQRHVLTIGPNGNVEPLNILDEAFLPSTRINGSTLPAVDPALVAAAPKVGQPDYAQAVVRFVQANVPDEFQGQQVNFYRTFTTTVRPEVAFPDGNVNEGLLPLLNLEVWGLPLSKPLVDPANANFVYQRFQRGIMQYDASTGVTQGLLLGDYLKAILTGKDLPFDLASAAQGSPYYQQYDPFSPDGLTDPAALPGTNLLYAFEPTK